MTSSVNPFPTFQYSQPEDYRFSHDSVFLARKVFEMYRDSGQTIQDGLDLCAGCGIIGLDFLFHCMQNAIAPPTNFDFIEVQETYRSHFKKNVDSLGVQTTKTEFINENYETLLSRPATRLYDLIVCNPPYFFKGHGKYPSSDLKTRSRFFIDSDLKNLIHFIQNRLSNTGQAFLLGRNQTERKFDVTKLIKDYSSTQIDIEVVADIRGTDLIRIQKTHRDRCS